MGLCSIVVGLLGSSIISTDKADAIPLLTSNLDNNLNGRDAMSNDSYRRSHFVAREFDWVDPPVDLINAKFDVIIGADLVYDVALFPLLASVFRRLLHADNYVLLSTRVRYDKDENFLKSLTSEYGLVVDTVHHSDDGAQHVVISKIYLPLG